MVQAPFMANSPTSKQGSYVLTPSKQANVSLRKALQEGRWSWFNKLAESISTQAANRRPALLIKLAQGGQFYRGWSLPSPWHGGGLGIQRPAYPGQAIPMQLYHNYGIGQPGMGVPQQDPMEQLHAQEQFLNQAMAQGRVSPARYEQLQQQLKDANADDRKRSSGDGFRAAG
jgi:hypothetical protein